MKNQLIIVLTAITLGAFLYTSLANDKVTNLVPPEIKAQFTLWKLENGKVYSGSENEYRLTVFYENIKEIQSLNDNSESATFSVNKFADLTFEEFKARHTGFKQIGTGTPSTELSLDEVPASINWVKKGAVTSIKNQEQCGGCWAFATAAALEGYQFITKNKLESLSMQQLIDCSSAYGNEGCDGGLPSQAYQYVIKKGIELNSEYPFTQQTDKCKYDPSKVVFRIGGFRRVQKYNNAQLKAAVAQQPVSVGVDSRGLQFYSGGILKQNCGQFLDHTVVIVGYGTQDGTPFWLVKNSWGVAWGEEGYFQVLRRTDKGPSPCGVSEQPTYPTGA